MCIVFKGEPKLEIATEDIKVFKYTYKTVDHKFLFIKWKTTKGFFYDKTYRVGKTYKEHLKKAEDYINNGMFSTSTGLYSYSSLINVDDVVDNCYIFRAIIPRGSKYYYDPDRGVYVSNKLKLILG